MRRRFRWGAVTGLLVFAAVVLFRKWFQRQLQETPPNQAVEYVIPYEAEKEEAEKPVLIDLPARVQGQETGPSHEGADDLTRIEGIGPKSAQVLAGAGISGFEQLAASSVEQLRQILREAGLRIVYPDTWSEQAALAAKGDWAGLEALQAQLDRGRRIKT